MRFTQTLVLSLMFVAVLGTVFVALIFKSSGPAGIIEELSTTQFVSEPSAVLHGTESKDLNTFFEADDEAGTTEPAGSSRTLPDNYMNTLELYRNRLRIAKGEDLRRLWPHDLREGYGRYKIPTKTELKKFLGQSVDKN